MTKAWKKFEDWVCMQLGGRRRLGGNQGNTGQNDCDDDVSRWSVEVKSHKRRSVAKIEKDAIKATERASGENQFGIAVMHHKFHDREDNTLVSMTWKEFMRLDAYIDWLEQGNGSLTRDALIDIRMFIDKKLGE